MTKKVCWIVTCVFLSLSLGLLAGCGGNQTASSGEANTPSEDNSGGIGGEKKGKSVSFDASLHWNEGDSYTQGWQEFIGKIESQTEGRVKFTSFYGGSLVSNAEALEAVENGSVDMAGGSAATMSGQIPEMALIEMIGGYSGEPEDFEGMLREAWPVLKDIFREHDVELIFVQGGNPSTIVMSPEKFFKTPEDYQGVKVRVAGRWQTEQTKNLGASPVTLDLGELYLGLQNQTIDATFAVNNLANSFSLYEVAPKITELRMPVNMSMYLMSKDAWNKLSDEDKAKIDEIGLEMAIKSHHYLSENMDVNIKEMEEKGAEFYYLTDEERDAFMAKMEPVIESIRQDLGENGQKLADIIDKYR